MQCVEERTGHASGTELSRGNLLYSCGISNTEVLNMAIIVVNKLGKFPPTPPELKEGWWSDRPEERGLNFISAAVTAPASPLTIATSSPRDFLSVLPIAKPK